MMSIHKNVEELYVIPEQCELRGPVMVVEDVILQGFNRVTITGTVTVFPGKKLVIE